MSFWKAIAGLISDTVARTVRIDASTHAMEVIDYEHHEIHGGSHFFVRGWADVPINNVFDVQFTTPNTTKWSHFTFQIDVESETEWFIYENVTITTPGTAITPINNNRNSGTASTNTVRSIANTSVANANADTAVAGATLLANAVIGAGKTAGVVAREREIIFRQGEDYCFRALANTAGYISFRMSWYEHTDKN